MVYRASLQKIKKKKERVVLGPSAHPSHHDSSNSEQMPRFIFVLASLAFPKTRFLAVHTSIYFMRLLSAFTISLDMVFFSL